MGRISRWLINTHRLRHRGIGFLPRLHPGRRMDVERGFQPLVLYALEKIGWVGEQQLVPGVSAPAFGMTGLIERLGAGAAGAEGKMPVHVEHKDIERQVVVAESPYEFFEFLVAVGPVARPPRAERKSRRQRDG